MKKLLLLFLLINEIIFSRVYFSTVDDLSQLVLSHLNSASDITIVAYSIDPEYLGLKTAKMASEVPVQGAFVHVSEGLLHSKFIVLDCETVIFGSANFNRSSLEEHLNNLIVFHSKEIADFFEGIYDWLVHGKRPQVRLKTEEGEFFLIPAVDVEEIVLDSLWKAKKYVLLCSYAFTDEDVFATLKFLSSQGVEVYIITDEWFESSKLRELPLGTFHILEVKEPLMHHKFLVVDGKTLITGSANFTESGFHKNVEVVFKTSNREYVESFVEEFERIWRGYFVQGVRF
ncbi:MULTISPECIES: phospholipase D-like domain-containing protein [unclassified Thermotoga]|uniref:phospholipase D-like domain-containing protein n=1 Tax=unclassified Thermotoga TaxID=2631113 RepID=UPI0005411C69|nr:MULTISPECIES: phospholipase D-like domain-containing protein [unclassified Thermotoga]MBZ4662263.1 phospholipase D/transphosphatidylase [Thermotoga sp.]AIY87642.1 phospholipase D/transphosphatidylase [Thermotoga sp. Cell2]KHC92573.1 phospholipase D/transphosphatidylase [Thermotoga sp. TBGT1765]KHC93544.1 phospholipase D/transphosphatidylase [Thermotoga sp. TBGT1766]KHC96413.1 phospholipase D/transphosphatidylase [Thermotoga sp. Xyl54]